MFDAINAPILFEHERSTNKEFCIDYEKSSMAAKCDALDRLVDRYFQICELSQLIAAKTPKKIQTAKDRLGRILRSLLWHFVLAARQSDDCFVKISLRDSSYRKNTAENPHHITREISSVIAALEHFGYIQRHVGFLDRKTGRSRMTRIRPSILLLQDLKSVPDDISEIYLEPDPVIIRNGYVSTLDEASRTHMEQANTTIKHYNEFMRSHDVTHPDAHAGFLPYQDKNGDFRLVNITRKAVRAIYHAEDEGVLSYGRIHGGMCQAIPSHLRQFITIDGDPTVELDYSAQVIHIVAGLEGIQLKGDPYSLFLDIPRLDPSLSRDIVKTAVVVMLNASDRKSLFRAIRSHFNRERRLKYCEIRLTDKFLEKVVDQVLEAHPFLKKHAMSGAGKKLFMFDAAIARNIIKTFLDSDKVILPIHDGFIVKQCDRNLLEETMKRVWFETFLTTIPVKVENPK